MEFQIQEVPLRKRSTPYDFIVEFSTEGGSRGLYKGASWRVARRSYWQAVNVAIFTRATATVRVNITRSRAEYGAFVTHIQTGSAVTVHSPSGKCVEWTRGSWVGEHLAEKLLATIPGMTGPIPASN